MYLQQMIESKLDDVHSRKARREEFIKEMEQLNISAEQKIKVLHKYDEEQNKFDRRQRKKHTVADFELVSLIGRGAFGEVCLIVFCSGITDQSFSYSLLLQVRLVRQKDTQEIFAMKVMKKKDMIKKNQVEHIRAEREVLSLIDNPNVVKLHYAFQVFLLDHFLSSFFRYLIIFLRFRTIDSSTLSWTTSPEVIL